MFVHAEDWLEFNTVQSGHARRDNPLAYQLVRLEHARTPVKPVLNSEPAYEDHPVHWNQENGFFAALEVRQHAYRSLFAGACGHTYGHYSVFQFHAPERPGVWPQDALYGWREALERPGALQMRFVREFMARFGLLEPPQDSFEQVCVAGSPGRVLAYFPAPEAMPPQQLEALKAVGWWNPQDGRTLETGKRRFPDGWEDGVVLLEGEIQRLSARCSPARV